MVTPENQQFIPRHETAPTHLAAMPTHELTGLPNREALNQLVANAMEVMPGDFALLEIDIDGLKAVNDEDGHADGDAYLQTVADVMAHYLRDEDLTVLHRSGDEFNVLLPHVNTQEDVDLVQTRLQKVLEEDYGIGASMGGRPHRVGETAEELFKAVDELAQQNKAARKVNGLTDEQIAAVAQIEEKSDTSALNLRDLPLIIKELKRRGRL